MICTDDHTFNLVVHRLDSACKHILFSAFNVCLDAMDIFVGKKSIERYYIILRIVGCSNKFGHDLDLVAPRRKCVLQSIDPLRITFKYVRTATCLYVVKSPNTLRCPNVRYDLALLRHALCGKAVAMGRAMVLLDEKRMVASYSMVRLKMRREI